jgi:SAM-dependent methyltransferase
MQREWNERAREDANFYVAFGRRDQDDEEFFATADELVRGLDWELRRMPLGANRRAWRALEIGCGPGRLMRPMASRFGEIHGIDVSDEMVQRAARNLKGIPHAHVHHTSGADLSPFADESFDFVYSYAVFQHIPSREVVMRYLREAHRVLKIGGLMRVQLNGLDQAAKQYDTWSGVRISAQEVRDYAREHGMQLLTLEGARTQYMWSTMRKRDPGRVYGKPDGRTRVRRITNAHNSEPVAPPFGRFASITLWVDYLPPECDLNELQVKVGGLPADVSYIGPPEPDSLQQVNVMLPRLQRSGLVPIEAWWNGQPLFEPETVRIIPAGPQVPVLLSATDGVDLLSGQRIVSGVVKVTVEETRDPESFQATVDGEPVTGLDIFCADPLPPLYEINFRLPPSVLPGERVLEMRLGKRFLGRAVLDVQPADIN